MSSKTLEGKKLVFLGDSITEGCCASSVEKRFTDLIAHDEKAICYNHGIGGTRLAYQTAPSEEPRHDLCFLDRVDELEADADLVIVFGGTNDYGHGDAALGTMEDQDPYTFYGAVHTLVRKLLAKYDRSKIVFILPLHRKGEEQTILKGGVMTSVTLAQYILALREVLEFYSISYLNLYEEGKTPQELAEGMKTYLADGLHPNDTGYRLLADMVIAFLKSRI